MKEKLCIWTLYRSGSDGKDLLHPGLLDLTRQSSSPRSQWRHCWRASWLAKPQSWLAAPADFLPVSSGRQLQYRSGKNRGKLLSLRSLNGGKVTMQRWKSFKVEINTVQDNTVHSVFKIYTKEHCVHSAVFATVAFSDGTIRWNQSWELSNSIYWQEETQYALLYLAFFVFLCTQYYTCVS